MGATSPAGDSVARTVHQVAEMAESTDEISGPTEEFDDRHEDQEHDRPSVKTKAMERHAKMKELMQRKPAPKFERPAYRVRTPKASPPPSVPDHVRRAREIRRRMDRAAM